MYKISFLIFFAAFILLGIFGAVSPPSNYIPVAILFILSIPILLFFSRRSSRIISLSEVEEERLQESINLSQVEIKNLSSKIKSSSLYLNRLLLLEEFQLDLGKEIEEEKICKKFLENLRTMFPEADNYLLYLLDFKEQALRLKHSFKKDSSLHIKEKEGDAIDKWVIRQNKGALIDNIRKDFRFALEGSSSRFISCICSVISSGPKILGDIRIESKKPSFFTLEDLRFLQVLSEIFSVHFDTSILYKRMQEMAIKDGLTGLYLRGYTLERFEKEIIRAKSYSHKIGILLCDIDHFKRINDKYGHLVGDMVLENISSVIKEVIGNAGNIICRFGGEEFLIIVPNLSKEEVINIAENLRAKVEDNPLIVRKRRISATISIGVSYFPQDGFKIQELIKKSDARLYLAKKTGRNRVCY